MEFFLLAIFCFFCGGFVTAIFAPLPRDGAPEEPELKFVVGGIMGLCFYAAFYFALEIMTDALRTGL